MTLTDVPAVEVRDLSRRFDGPPDVVALAPCSFQIQRGEFVSIAGPSGSGKTTLLSILGLLDTPTSGEYLLAGDDVASLSDRERTAIRAHEIGFVFQAFHLVNYRSVIDNVELGLTYQGIGRQRRRAAADEVVEQVGLAHRRNALCSVLSGGEKQRVAIARTLVRRPMLVLCDEPTGNLDSASSHQVLDLVHELHDGGLTVIVITHDHGVASRADRRFSIVDGFVTETQPTPA